MTYRRQRLALGALAMIASVAALAATPQAGRAATVSCPEVQLLSEELTRSPSVFVGIVQAPFQTDAGRGASITVLETWRGPDLAPVVRVTIEDAAGAPRVELVSGTRYLVAANPPADATSSGDTVDALVIPACSVTRPWTPDLADLRPPDARPMEGAAPSPATSSQASAPGWLWAGSAVLLLAALGVTVVAISRRPALLPAATVLSVAGIAVLGATVVLSLAPQTPEVGPSASPSVPTPSLSQESLSPDGHLVVRLEVMRGGTRLSVVSIHADGRLISGSSDAGGAPLSERKLSAGGLRLVLEAMEATGLPSVDAPAVVEYVPEPLEGGDPGTGDITGRLTYTAEDGSNRSVRWALIDADDADDVADAPEIERLETFAQQLLAPEDWLLATAWVSRDHADYHAETFHVLVTPIPFGSARPAIDMSDLPAPLRASLGALEPAAALPACVQLARSQATELLAAIAARFNQIGLTLAADGTDVAADDEERSVTYRLSLRPLLPDEGKCPEQPSAEPTDAELAPGAIALVRVDDLRVRSGAGSSFEAINSFAAGDRVAVVAGPVTADGMDWYEVRQGPSGRGGLVAGGPAGGDPWLVPIADGAIGFTEGDGTGTLSVGRMNPDGNGLSTLVDGGGPVWSPDGRRFAFSVYPGQASTWQLATAAPDGSQVSRLGEGEYPTWSPDGSLIAFGRGDEIWVMNADGTGQRLLVAGAEPWSVAWDPDGSRLAYVFPLETESGGEGMMFFSPRALGFVDVVSGEVTQVTTADNLDGSTNPKWSPDGTRLTYGGNRLIDDSGDVVLQLEPGVTWADAPWSPSGNELALIVDGSIEILELVSGERRTVTAAENSNQLIWSPGGSHLAFTRAGGDRWQIHVVDADGGEPVTIGPPFSQFPAWQPIVSHGLD
ncbi:MAG TPA: hypothetical protein VMP86_08945 [Candidatus Binatia bacterium]|nr:hypothetical protein [Candidatus Binatia bacterium]